LLLNIDGNGPIEQVYDEMKKQLLKIVLWFYYNKDNLEVINHSY
jgi:hypothetical protein